MISDKEKIEKRLNFSWIMYILRVRVFSFFLCSLIFFCLGFFFFDRNSQSQNTYLISDTSATAQLLIEPIRKREITVLEYGLTENTSDLLYGEEFGLSKDYLEKVISENMDLSVYVDNNGVSYISKSIVEILDSVEVLISRKGNIASVTVIDSNKKFSSDLANALAMDYQNRIDGFYEMILTGVDENNQTSDIQNEDFGKNGFDSSSDSHIYKKYEKGKAFLIEKANYNQDSLDLQPAVDNEKMKIVIFIVSLVFGLSTGVMLLIFMEMKYSSIREYGQLEKYCKNDCSVLGWIPLFKFKPNHNKDRLVTQKFEHTSDAELFRKIVEKLLRSKECKHGKVLTFTSTSEGDGKSFVISNVAVSLAKAGKRVLVMNGVGSSPGVESYFGYSKNKVGFSDYVFSDQLLESCFFQSDLGIDNLFFIEGGGALSLDLILNKKFEMGLHLLQDSFDFILIDAPSSYFGSEVFSLSKYSDGVVIVVRAGISLIESLEDLVEQIVSINITPFFIFNGVIENLTMRGTQIQRWNKEAKKVFYSHHKEYDTLLHAKGFRLGVYKKYYNINDQL